MVAGLVASEQLLRHTTRSLHRRPPHQHHRILPQRQSTNEVPDAIVHDVPPEPLGKSALPVVLSTTILRGKIGYTQGREQDFQYDKGRSWCRTKSKAISLNSVFHFLSQHNGRLPGRGIPQRNLAGPSDAVDVIPMHSEVQDELGFHRHRVLPRKSQLLIPLSNQGYHSSTSSSSSSSGSCIVVVAVVVVVVVVLVVAVSPTPTAAAVRALQRRRTRRNTYYSACLGVAATQEKLQLLLRRLSERCREGKS